MRGELRVGQLTSLYLDQKYSQLDDSKSVLENVQSSCDISETEARNGLARFLFTKDSVFQKARSLSGGERMRAAFAQGLLGAVKPELLILDEPTNNLDLVNIEFLEALISHFKGALVVVSHDDAFLENCKLSAELDLG